MPGQREVVIGFRVGRVDQDHTRDSIRVQGRKEHRIETPSRVPTRTTGISTLAASSSFFRSSTGFARSKDALQDH